MHKDLAEESAVARDEEATVEIKFSPPLYQQRYNLALQYLTDHGVKSVVDFGCAECSFFKLLPTIPSLQKVFLVDVDRKLVMSKKRIIEPELRHFIFRRQNPLHVQLYVGSAADFDSRIAGCDAVTLIEVIEHLHHDILHQVTENIFQKYKPKVCIVTTPNSEFNPLFQDKDTSTFRHWDHKFEWTRKEFRTWCENVCSQFGYQVEFTGAGYLSTKPETFHIGPCSQAAIFVLSQQDVNSSPEHNSVTSDVCYELIAESNFPHETCQLTQEEVIDMEISYHIRQIAVSRFRNLEGTDDTNGYSEELEHEDKFHINIDRIASMRSLRDLCDKDRIRERLQSSGLEISDDGQQIIASMAELLGMEDKDCLEDETDDYSQHCRRVEEAEGNEGMTNSCQVDDKDGMGIQWESDWDLTNNNQEEAS